MLPDVNTQYVCITKSNWLMPFREIIVVCSENPTKQVNARTLCEQTAEFCIKPSSTIIMCFGVLKG
jgi:hypothetical protein